MPAQQRRKVTDGNLNLISDEKARKRSFAKRARGLLGKSSQLSSLCGAKVITLIHKDDEFFFFCDKGEGTDWFHRAKQLQVKMRQPGTHIRGFFSEDYLSVFSSSGKWMGTEMLESDVVVSDVPMESTERLREELERQAERPPQGCPQLSVETLYVVPDTPPGSAGLSPVSFPLPSMSHVENSETSMGHKKNSKMPVERKGEQWCLRFLWSQPKPMGLERAPLGKNLHNRTLECLVTPEKT